MLLVTSRTVGFAVALAAASALTVTAPSAVAATPAAAPAIAFTSVAATSGAAGAASASGASGVAFVSGASGVAFVSVPPPVRDEDRPGGSGDRLIVTVHSAGLGRDGTYELVCHPAAGSHPDPRRACAAVDRNTHWGRDPFAPVPQDSVCTMIYGGPATAHVTGSWAGRPVNATYKRSDGCEIERWNRMVPLLPDLGS
ncbi:SSI family serine proteinase inhibitor [Streptomyces sp. NPDC102462]|uniref:SSI family serine proteinase inhibitor n=1 Tax=Streptomyces sp. NPDC102462 TaxID=3366178 RepID=UPI00382D16E7